MPSPPRRSALARFLGRSRVPKAVERAIERAITELPRTSSEVESCDACGRVFFLADMEDESTQERELLLCSSCSDRRRRLRADGLPHHPYPLLVGWCVCGEPADSPYHF